MWCLIGAFVVIGALCAITIAILVDILRDVHEMLNHTEDHK